MGNVVRLPDSPLGAVRRELSQVLERHEFAYTIKLFEAYYFRKAGGKKNVPKSVRANLLTVQDMISFVGKAPWNITRLDFDKWCEHLARERGYKKNGLQNTGVASSTERKYQGVIQDFYYFLTHEDVIALQLYEQFGVTKVKQIVNRDNRIPHTTEDETDRIRTNVPKNHIDVIFNTYAKAIREAHEDRCKSLYPLLRDRVLFYLTYTCGLRASETLRLNLESFFPNPDYPEFGEFGVMVVFGKGSKGSGLRRREFVIEDPKLPELLTAYLKHVRPKFLHNCKIGERAIFLSNWGRRLSLASFEARFKKILQLAHLEEYNYVPHCMRHSSVTEKITEYSLEATRRMHGHKHSSTTQNYAHVGDSYVSEVISSVINKNIEQYNKLKEQQERMGHED